MRFETEGDLRFQLDKLLNKGLDLFDNFRLPVELGIETEFNRVGYDWPSEDSPGVLSSNGSGLLSWGAGDSLVDHGGLNGRADDDHEQYILEDGTRAFSGDISHGDNDITDVTNLDGTLSEATQPNVTTIGTLIAGAVPASLITPGTFGAGDYGFPGDVGIGTSTPDRPLEIRSVSPVLRLRATGSTATQTAAFVEFGGTTAAAWSRTGFVGDPSSGNTDIALVAEQSDLHLGDSSSSNVLNLQGGNVGIGETAPDSKLEVNGTLHIIGAATFDSFVTIDDPDQWLLLTDTVTSGSVDLTFQNGTTGTGAAGFQIGITATEKAILLNYENTDMLFHVNNTLAATLAPGGNLTLVGNAIIAGGMALNLVNKTTTYVATTSDHTINCDTSGGAFTVTLPAASAAPEHILNIKQEVPSANLLTVDGDGTDTIDNALTATFSYPTSLTVQSDGVSNWIII